MIFQKNFLDKHMNKNFTRFIILLSLVFISFLQGKALNLPSLEEEIITYNRAGKHMVSQKKLSEILLTTDISAEERANVLFLMASTYRSVNDYLMCIDYLERSQAIAEKLPKDNTVLMRIDYEFAYVYFDTKDYEKCGEVMKRIANHHYKTIYPEDKAYILMQEGFLLLKDNKYGETERKYTEALGIMEKVSRCNLPMVYGKMMELYNLKKDIIKVENMYDQAYKIADECGILKYKVFLAAELERIYKENDLFTQAYEMGLKVDSLRNLEDQGNVISEMHILDKAYIEKGTLQEEEEILTKEKIGAIIVATLLLSFIVHSVLRGRRLKNDKIRMREEIKQMKEDLHSYSHTTHFNEKNVDPENEIFNYEKLTERQKELLKLMANGSSNKEIAEKLFITESTVKYHIKNIFSILELKDRRDLFKKMSNN